MIDPVLAEAARYEAKVRQDGSPKRVLSGLLNANAATIDFQAWSAIAGLFETGQFEAVQAGGVREDTVISWPECQAAAERAVASLTKLLAEASPDKRPALERRRHLVSSIARKVALRRATIEDLNRQLRDRAERDDVGTQRAA